VWDIPDVLPVQQCLGSGVGEAAVAVVGG